MFFSPDKVDEVVELIKKGYYKEASNLLDQLVTSEMDARRFREAIGRSVMLGKWDDHRLRFAFGSHGIHVINFTPDERRDPTEMKPRPEEYLADVRFNAFEVMKEAWSNSRRSVLELHDCTSIIFPPYVGRYVIDEDHVLLFPVVATGFFDWHSDGMRMTMFIQPMFTQEYELDQNTIESLPEILAKRPPYRMVHIVPGVDVTEAINKDGYFGNLAYKDMYNTRMPA